MSNLLLTSKKYLQNLYSYRIQTSEPRIIYFNNTSYNRISLDKNFEGESFPKALEPYIENNRNSEYFSNNLLEKLKKEFKTEIKDYYYQIFSVSAFPNDNFDNYLNFLILSLKNI